MKKISYNIGLLTEYADELSSRIRHLPDPNCDLSFHLNYIHHICKTIDHFCLTLYKEVYDEKNKKKE